jgi:hypothetical protein
LKGAVQLSEQQATQAQRQRGIWRRVFWMLAIVVSMLVFVILNAQDLSGGEDAVRVDKRTAEAKTEQFWAAKGITLTGYLRTAVLQDDTSLDGYLSLHHYTESYQKSFSDAHPVQYWEITYYKPNDGNRYVTRIHPKTASVIGFEVSHPTMNKVSKAHIDTETESGQADVAKDFARQQLQALNLKDSVPLMFVQRNVEEGTVALTFQVGSKRIGEAPLQVVVKLDSLTGTPSGFQTTFAVPATDKNWFALQSKHSEIMTWMFLAGQILLFLFACIILYVKRHEVRYKTAFWLIVAAFIIDWVNSVNSLPNLQDTTGFTQLPIFNLWRTSGSLGLYVLVTTVLEIGMLYFITVAGGALAREMLPNRWLSWNDPQWPQRIRAAALRGYGIAILWLGFQSLFYYIGETLFHVWEQNDTTSSPWNNVFPGIMPVAAWFAGINEELTFRLFGYSLVKKYLKSTWLALVLPAMIWALGHSLYPVYPVYTRFIELTIFGTWIGWCMLKWNIETVIFAHVAFDSILMSLALLSDQPVQMAPFAVFWAFSPLLVGLCIGMWRPRRSKDA